MQVNTNYGEAVKKARAAAKLTEIQVAIKLGMSRQQYDQIEKGIYGSTAKTMARLMTVLPALKPEHFFVVGK